MKHFRSDSSAARGMCSRVGIGRTRHLDAVMMWLQQKCHDKVIRVPAIPTRTISADIGTKALARARMFMTGMVDDDSRELGKDEFRDIERKMLSDKGAKKILSGLKDERRMALVMAFVNVIRASGTKEENEPNGAESDSWMWPVLAILAGVGALSLVQWLWSFFVKKIQKEVSGGQRQRAGGECT